MARRVAHGRVPGAVVLRPLGVLERLAVGESVIT